VAAKVARLCDNRSGVQHNEGRRIYMNAIKATWKGGQILPCEPVNWPEGCDLVVEPLPTAATKIGLDESEWRDDPASLADWEAWIRFEPLEITPEEAERFARFNDEMRRYNLEAVRRQMEEERLP
jgi:hypothetical protein